MKQPALAKKVASLRIEKGLTQAELAEMCNVTVRTIQRIESAEVEPEALR
ncbi:helix-turn-helix transcriptional regulator [Flavobacterium sp. MAH-1]|uniref:Helix-turn-helix transcriptional regulator n=1 Tax=Flavobacterium agri TaxID=2743471 RepID=A0A7Y8XYJ7_9FLAO|nr:helix-turn-helix transcriptional regulator [Flavobacterium agri]NUY79287.1 helix-turn-helix transcriptional regulator [Flavobacterium agri]NYA69311.1 helix-turn-helix transcriptional regulator [Flavobacterium agri]